MDTALQDLLARYLRQRQTAFAGDAASLHLDEDTLATFAEGRLTEREALPVVAHLADCGNCRRITGELIKLEISMADADIVSAVMPMAEEQGLSQSISNWFSRVFGSTDATVFAHSDEGETTDEETNGKEDQ